MVLVPVIRKHVLDSCDWISEWITCRVDFRILVLTPWFLYFSSYRQPEEICDECEVRCEEILKYDFSG